MLMLAALAAAACGGGAASKHDALPPATTAMTPAQIAERALPSVVLIRTPIMIGTGFVVWKDGRIATNLHVLAGAREATVILTDKREFSDIEVLAVDPAHDLAIIRVAAKGLVPLVLGDSGAVKAGEHVVAIGHPLGLGNTVSDGIVSAVRDEDPQARLLQITAPIAPGSSGGPIFNEHAEVIGVATLFASEGQNLNFGVPVSYLKPMLLAEQAISLEALNKDVPPDAGPLEGCTVDEVKQTVSSITDAIKVGSTKFNSGDADGCFQLYQVTALKLVGSLKGCQAVRQALLDGVTAANRAPDAKAKAWAIRHAFDRVLSVVDAVLKQVERQQQQAPAQPEPPPKK